MADPLLSLAQRLVEVHHAAAVAAVPLAQALASFTREELADGAVMMAEGQPAQSLHVLAEGQVAITVQGRELVRIPAPAVLGHLGVLVGLDRTATVEARGPITQLRIGRDEMWRLVDGTAAPGAALRRLLLAAMSELLVQENVQLSAIAPPRPAPAPKPAREAPQVEIEDEDWGFGADLMAQADELELVMDEASRRRRGGSGGGS